MLRIEPLGTRFILPAFVVGFELSGESERRIDDLDDSPAWLIALDQQAGGHCMSYPSVLGAILRFADNGRRCRSDVGDLIRGFQALAEDPNIALLRRDYPELAELVYTRGDEYGRTQLLRLQRYVERFFDIPPIGSGLEAFVSMALCDPLAYFAGWQMLTAIPKAEPRQLYRGQKSIYIDESNIGLLEISSNESFGEQALSVIRAFGNQLALGEVRVFLLWENSD